MTMRIPYTGIVLLSILAASVMSHPLKAQMKIGDNARTLNPDAILEMESSSRGFLLPRVSLRSTTMPDPLRAFTAGMMVYNIASINNVSPGIYVCDGTKWIKANEPASNADSASGQNVFWSLRGNAAVTASQFLGTVNVAPIIVRTNNIERMRVSENGWIGIGTATPRATLHVKGQLVVDSLGAGNASTDRWLVANPSDGRVKLLSNAPFMTGTQTVVLNVGSNGQSVFQTPATITDPNKVFLYRNGVLISFTLNNSTSIISELPCVIGDQIRIVQLL